MKKLLSVSLIAFMAFSCGMMQAKEKSLKKNGVNVMYTKDVPDNEANKLVDYLATNNEDGSAKDFKLSKEADGFRVKMIVMAGYESDDKNIELMNDFACEISKDVFEGKTVYLDLCDEYFKLKKGLKSENCDQFAMLDKKMVMYGENELYYGESITMKQQDEVGKYLSDVFGDDERKTFVIDQVDGKGVLSIVVTSKKYYNDPELLDIYRVIACDLTKILGFTTDVHMCDEYMKTQKVVVAEKCDK